MKNPKIIIERFSKTIGVEIPSVRLVNRKSHENNLAQYTPEYKLIELFINGRDLNSIKHEFLHYLQHLKIELEFGNKFGFWNGHRVLAKRGSQGICARKFGVPLVALMKYPMLFGYHKSERKMEYEVKELMEKKWEEIKIWFKK